MTSETQKRIPVWPFAGLLVLLPIGYFAWSRPTASVDEASAAQKEKQKDKDKDGITVPDGTPTELLKFMRAKVDKLKDSPPDKKEDFIKVLKTVAQAAEKVLAMKATSEQRLEAVQAKWAILRGLSQSGEKSAAKEIPKFLGRFLKDKDADIREFATGRLLADRAEHVGTLNNKQREQLTKDALEFATGGKLEDRYSVLMLLGQFLESNSQGEMAARIYRATAARIAKSDDKDIAKQAKIVEGYARRSVLLGKTFELQGTKVDGKPFKWSDYKGKVVLVDFWATWCRPCREAMPSLKKYYETYRDKGFEIVGVSVDEELDALTRVIKGDEIPWTNLFSRDPKAAGGLHPMAVYYGVDRYPTTFLIDQSGKVIERDVHGARLGRLLAKLLEKGDGKAAAKPDAKAKAKSKDTPK